MISYQHGNPEVINNYDLFGKANKVIEVRSDKDGYVDKIKTLQVGNVAMLLGAGRATKDEKIDPVVGLEIKVKVGSKVSKK